MNWERIGQVIEIADAMGLDFFDVKFEVVPWDVMHEIASYGLPIRAHHWSYGRTYRRLQIHGRMGMSKIYEIVLNNDPAYAFLLESNTEVENLLIAAHVAAHADFFKNNAAFADAPRDMVNEAAQHALRIERYKEKHGQRRVERLMDAAFALERHIDARRGVHREPYPQPKVVEKEVQRDAYADLFPEEDGFTVRRETRGGDVPPHPEHDLLWFLSQHAPLEPWERDVLDIVREESHYFYPQFNTKILNEGWATYWHAEVIQAYDGMTPSEMIDFSSLHAGVVRPGGPMQTNPYYLGYKVLKDVKRRWDKKFAAKQSDIDGAAKLFEVRAEEDDFSFLRNHLTQALVDEMELYVYAPAGDSGSKSRGHDRFRSGEVVVKSKAVEDVVEQLLRGRYNYGVPEIVISKTRGGRLYLDQIDAGLGGLDRAYAERALELVAEIWKGPVTLTGIDGAGKALTIAAGR